MSSVIRTCRSCGRQVYRYPVDQSRSRVDWPDVFLDDLELDDPSLGEVALTDDDEAVVGNLGTGPYLIHRCAQRAVSCRHCGASVIRVTRVERSGENWAFAILNADPDPAGTLTLDENGHATTQLDAYPDGERYAVHRDRRERPANPNPLDLPRRARQGLAPSSIRHTHQGSRESA